MRDLGVPGKKSRAYRINDRGQVLGLCEPSWTTLVWEKGKITYPEKQPVKDFGAFQGLDINELGDIAGAVDRGGTCGRHESRVFLYSGDKIAPVETTARKMSNALGLTSDGLVVGNAFDTPTGQHAFVWRDGKSALLNDLIAEPGWDVYFARAVNERGQVLGAGRHGARESGRKPVVLTPVRVKSRFTGSRVRELAS